MWINQSIICHLEGYWYETISEDGGEFVRGVAAADSQYIAQLSRLEMIVPESDRTYAIGSLVLACRPGLSLAQIEDLSDLLIKNIAIANPNYAPYGQAAKESLLNSHVWKSVEDKLIFANNVNEALNYLLIGNVDAAIIDGALAYLAIVNLTFSSRLFCRSPGKGFYQG